MKEIKTNLNEVQSKDEMKKMDAGLYLLSPTDYTQTSFMEETMNIIRMWNHRRPRLLTSAYHS